MIRYHARHSTVYEYGDPVTLAHHVIHLSPRRTPYQNPLKHRITVTPEPTSWNARTDVFGNAMVQFAIEQAHRRLVVEAQSDVEVAARPPPPAEARPWDALVAGIAEAGPETIDAFAFIHDSTLIEVGDDLAAFAEADFPPGRPVVAALTALTHRINSEFVFDPKATTVSTPVREVLAEKRGVCQDFAHVMIGALRSLGLPARYVSGYLRTRPPPGRPRLIGSDQSHAWVAVWIGGGWLECDPTNDCLAGVDHITLGWGRDYDDVAPLRGIINGGTDAQLEVGVDVIAQID